MLFLNILDKLTSMCLVQLFNVRILEVKSLVDLLTNHRYLKCEKYVFVTLTMYYYFFLTICFLMQNLNLQSNSRFQINVV